MKKWIYSFVFVLSMMFSSQAFCNETIVIMRHAEKPAGGLGQITCQGLNRALALPKVLTSKYGKPNYIFAPDTHVKVNEDSTHSYSYVRPLATIEPTAIQLSMPVETPYGYTDYKAMTSLLLANQYHNSVIFVAWEHLYAVMLAQYILTTLNANIVVPMWPDADYDSLYVINIDWTKIPYVATFTHDYEKLNNQSTICATK